MREEKSKESEASFLKSGLSLDRRDFLKLIGGGIIVFLHVMRPIYLDRSAGGQAIRPISTPICGSLRMAR
jgi:hypothetical protein